MRIFAVLLMVLIAGCASQPDSLQTVEKSSSAFEIGAHKVSISGLLGDGERPWTPVGGGASVTMDAGQILTQSGKKILAPALSEYRGEALEISVDGALFAFTFDVQSVGSRPVASYSGYVVIADAHGVILLSRIVDAEEIGGTTMPFNMKKTVEGISTQAADAFWQEVLAELQPSP